MSPNKLKITSLRIARVIEVFRGNKTDNQSTDKRLFCKLYMMEGTYYDNVPFYGGTVDIVTKKLHGVFAPPVVDQMVGVQFIDGHFENPYCCFSVPMPYISGKDSETFNNAFEEFIPGVADVGVFQKSGSYAILRESGTVELYSAENETVEVNGKDDFAVRFNKLKEAFDQLKTDHDNLVTLHNTHIHITTATVGATAVPGILSATVSAGSPSTADMTAAKVDNVLIGKD